MELKPCPFCGKFPEFEAEEKHLFLHGYGIGCVNLDCGNSMTIGYGITAKKARQRAYKKWNRRSSDV